ncbi:hypothetical protein [Sphingomonas nostoxanthinifaciens]|uniref:hypothetical protein n=1 Tax=Sphingomonas nostoxanthinifaciens TaxID=2872652 RepID=UPI001CC1D4C6|nr:hypothetical protein [Sphingomonas nostoxanthinifaciens]UAK23639.1 hypothetical protein K8P63_14785 [Sphingomonas nostoxanthinifaciens]
MSRRAITQAELNAAPRITPTGYAEEAYQARRSPMAVGPAGLPIPSARATYRTTVDGPLLVQIARRAYAEWRAAQLPQLWTDAVAARLLADLRERFPAADMEVLKRYGLAAPQDRVVVDMTEALYEKPVFLTLPAVIELPAGAFRYRWREQGQGAPIPEAVEPYFATGVAVRRAEQPDFMKVVGWPSQFKLQNKRWPTWREIEAAWPRIAEWLAEQRGRSCAR